jgi:hypothetical protein
MKLHALIKGQEIFIDNHQRGSGAINNWDDSTKDIHIHKTAYHPKNVKVEILIPLNSNRGITMKEVRNGVKSDTVPHSLEKEIRGALENLNIRVPFICDLKDILKNYSSILSSKEKVKGALTRLSNHFGLHWTEDIISKEYAFLFEDDETNKYHVKMNNEGITYKPKGIDESE